ncbi:hypothetical protein CI102_15091, partial [Trichoderma harzianum]
MPLAHLPNELLEAIAHAIQLERDINALVQTNRHIYNLLNTYLYQHNVRFCGSRALLWACEHGRAVTAQRLLREGADTYATSTAGRNPLTLAAENGYLELVKLLLKFGVNTQYPDAKQRTSLSRAAENGHAAIVELLLENGLDKDS